MGQFNKKQTIDLLEALLHGLAKGRAGKRAILAVESGDKSFRWTGTSGHSAAGEAVVANTPFFIASIDKLYNATIALMLAERGKLDVDESICHYLPDTLVRGLHHDGRRDRTAEITLRHLLTHTSGLAEWLEDYPKGRPSLVETVLQEGDRALTVDEIAAHVRDRLRPHFPPQKLTGSRVRVRYSDTNFVLLVEVIEAVTGLPLHEIHRQMLHEPLGLQHSYFPGHNQALAPTSTPMMLCVNGEPLHIPLLIQSVKGIYSTAADMMSFMRHLMQWDLFLEQKTLATMRSGWRRFGFPLDRAALRSPNWPIEYGMGMMRFRIPRLFTPLTPMPAVLGHTGSTGCWLFYCPDLDILISGTVEDVTAGAVPFRTVPKVLRVLSESGYQPPDK